MADRRTIAEDSDKMVMRAGEQALTTKKTADSMMLGLVNDVVANKIYRDHK
jgi:hypothetical protein